MTQAEKLLENMRRNPRDWRIADLEALAKRFGLKARKAGGSHAVFFHEATGKSLSVPATRPIKPIYVQSFLALLDDLGATK